MAIKYPTEATTTPDKLEFCYIAQEKLRLEHNAKGEDFNKGNITKSEWLNYKNGRFEDKQNKICAEIVSLRTQLKESVRFNVDLDNMEQ